ncbi:hypothetical protein ACKKBG_A02475 [Auxenochlorella protothecoides x Auxenochlorella symbiontica]
MAAVSPAPAPSHPIPEWLKGHNLTGPFISGTSHRVFVLGQNPADAEDAEAKTPAARKSGLKTRSSGPAAASEASGSASRAWPVSLADLVGAGLLTPGPDALSVLYKGSTHSAALLADGTIRYDGKAYGSASAFSIHVKRLITPDKQGDDGWKSVLYQGKPLDVYRRQLRDTMSEAADEDSGPSEDEEGPGDGGTGGTSRAAPAASAAPAGSGPGSAGAEDARSDAETPPASKRARTGEGRPASPGSGKPPSGRHRSAAARPSRSRLGRVGPDPAGPSPAGAEGAGRPAAEQAWVQCDACHTWRAVPDAAVAAELAAAGADATWHCRDASWDVRAVPPGDPPCAS